MSDRTDAAVTHELKCWREYYTALERNEKHFEIRRADRDFRSCDLLHLREWDKDTEEYTGREAFAYVLRVWKGLPGLSGNYVAMDVVVHGTRAVLFDRALAADMPCCRWLRRDNGRCAGPVSDSYHGDCPCDPRGWNARRQSRCDRFEERKRA